MPGLVTPSCLLGNQQIPCTHDPPPAPLPPPPAQSLAANIVEAYYRLEPFLRAAVASFVRQHLDTFAENEDGSDKQFWISIYGMQEMDRLRSLRSNKIGKLSQFVGTVTRTTDVRPELFTGTFRCMECMTGARLWRSWECVQRCCWLGCGSQTCAMAQCALCTAALCMLAVRWVRGLHQQLRKVLRAVLATRSGLPTASSRLPLSSVACLQWSRMWSSSSSTHSQSSAPTRHAATREPLSTWAATSTALLPAQAGTG